MNFVFWPLATNKTIETRGKSGFEKPDYPARPDAFLVGPKPENYQNSKAQAGPKPDIKARGYPKLAIWSFHKVRKMENSMENLENSLAQILFSGNTCNRIYRTTFL